MTNQVIQFKVSLNHVSPKVWRRIQVPETYTFWNLHCAIQDVMGWMNCHLHGFILSEKNARLNAGIRIQMPNPEWDEGGELDESKERLMDWFPKRVKQCLYTYDFGDTWDHTILFEKLIPAEQKTYPVCIAGKNACPPEDCGGPGGYEYKLEVIKNPKTDEDKEIVEWMGLEEGEEYDPTFFNMEEIYFTDPKTLLKEHLRDQEM